MTQKKDADPSGPVVITGYKKVVCKNSGREYVLELRIPAKTNRVFPTFGSGKARAERARVVKIWLFDKKSNSLKDTTRTKITHQCYHDDTKFFDYHLGEMAVPHRYDPSRGESCGAGISFFRDIYKAKHYN